MLEKEDKFNQLLGQLHAQNVSMLLTLKECLELDMGLNKLFHVTDDQARVLLQHTSSNISDLRESGSRAPFFQLKCSAHELSQILENCKNPLLRTVAQESLIKK